jgi:adenine-specific DNA-methyltransferase
MNKHKTLGQVFTPTWIVSEILNLVGYNDDTILDKYILEPSCGDGVFLLEIVERYINVSIKNNIGEEDIVSNLEKYIYGVEIDSIEYQKSIQNLNNLVEKQFSKKVKINWNIFNENTLDFYKDYNSFFHFIVGNPPYIRIHNLDLETKNNLKQNFIFSEGTIDIYLSFIEMAFKMANNKGSIGFITPNSYLHNSSYKLFRKFIKEKKILKTLIDFKANKVFQGFSTYTAISIFNLNYANDYFDYKEYIDNEIKLVNKVSFNNLSTNDWSFANKDDEDFLHGLSQNRNTLVKDFFDVQYGFATLRDKIFISNTTPYDNEYVTFNDFIIEKGILKKIVKGSKFKGEVNENELIIYPYELQNNRYKVIEEDKLKEKFPKAYAYLMFNKEELEKRDLDKGAVWYEFGRSQGVQSIHKEKIVLSTLVNGSINYYRLPKDVMIYSGLFIVKNKDFVNWDMIENILKSDEFYKYIRLTGKDFSGGYKSITSKQLKEYKLETNKLGTAK